MKKSGYLEAFRVLETDDDAFEAAPDEPGPLYGLGLPDPTLKRVYHENAGELMPRARLEDGQD